MRVGVDARHLAAGRGVAQYTRSLLATLAAAHPGDEWRCFVPGRGPLPPASAALPDNVTVVRSRRPSRVVFGAAATVRRPRLDRLLGGGLDAVWLPAPAPVALSASVPYVLTVHDLSWEERPSDFTRYERLWHRLARPAALARGAARVLAVSPATAQAAQAAWALDAARVCVAAPGVAQAPERGDLPPDLPDRFLLFVGALEPRKAPDALVRAYVQARRDGLDVGLVVVGDGRLAGVFADLPETTLLPGDLARPALEALYAAAVAVVAPSWLEGFGFVPLEAGVHGTPSVLSTVFADTMGDAALFVAPGDEPALTVAIERIGTDGALASALGAAARRRAAAFTWESAAAAVYAALAETAGVPVPAAAATAASPGADAGPADATSDAGDAP